MTDVQVLTDYFNKIYVEATKSSKPTDWCDAALIARQLVNALVKEGIVTDNYHQELSKQEELLQMGDLPEIKGGIEVGGMYSHISHRTDKGDNSIDNLTWCANINSTEND